MCPAGWLFVQAIIAFSFNEGQWVNASLCEDKATGNGAVYRDDTGEKIDIYQALVPKLGAQWFIVEKEKE